MKVGLVVDTFSVRSGTGIARYSQELMYGLLNLGIDIQQQCLTPLRLPLGSVIDHMVRLPLLIIQRISSLCLLHATSPVCAFVFPFVSKPKVVTYHDLTTLLCKDTDVSLYARLFAPLSLRIGKFSDRVIVDSSQTKKEVIKYLGIPEKKVVIVNLGVSDQFIPTNRKNKDEYIIGYIGALNRRKRLDYLLLAFQSFKIKYPQIPARLVICGSKKWEYNKLIKLATRLGLTDVVEFKGFVREDILVGMYNSFDVFVSSSEWEGFGLPILEAQRCGVPVVIRENAQISSEVSRFCQKSKSEEDMADKIYQLLTDPYLRSMIVSEALEYSRQFTWKRTVQETCEVYMDLV